VYELFLTTAPQAAFTCADVLGLYLHRGSFETVLADEDREQDTDRWCSHTPCGQEFWQILNQWLWNLRLDLGQHLSPSPVRLTEFAPAAEPPAIPPSELVGAPLSVASHEPPQEPPAVPPSEPVEYGPPQWARRSFTNGFAGADFVPQADGTLRCPAGHPLAVHERRPERYGSVRVVYGARIAHCRPCPLRAQCQETTTTRKPRQVSAVLWPIPSVAAQPPPPPVAIPFERERTPPLPSLAPTPPLASVLWGDWPRCLFRRRWLRLLRTQTVELTFGSVQSEGDLSANHDDVQTRAQRAHWRLSWQQRMAANARPSSAPVLTITIYGLPAAFARYVGVSQITAA